MTEENVDEEPVAIVQETSNADVVAADGRNPDGQTLPEKRISSIM